LAVIVFSGPSARAELRFGETHFDAGTVKSGQALKHRFDFINEGAPVQIVETRASCGCLKPELRQDRYGPQEKGFVTVEVNTLAQAAGPHRWAVHIDYRDGENENRATLELTGEIINEVTVQPAALTIYAGGALEHRILVSDLRARPLTITRLVASSPRIRARLSEESRDSAGHLVRTIRLDIAADYPEGRHEEALTIMTDDPDYPALRVNVTVIHQPKDRLSAAPAEVSIVAARDKPLPSPIVLLRDRDDRPIEVEEIVADHTALTCRWVRGPGKRATLRLIFDGKQLTGDEFSTFVHVRTKSPASETITIPVRCRLR
jgi:hypothetical protein